MIEKKYPDFAEFGEFASLSSGGKILFATDDFFASCENMISDSDPIFIPDKYTEFGKWMDGWETRRKRTPGHDWCIIKLATKCIIKGLLLDTAFFTGNYAPKYSIQAAYLTPEDENQIPARCEEMGSACSDDDKTQIKSIKSDKWTELVPVTSLRPGYEETRLNFQKVLSDEAWTHIRVNIYPDGGIARIRVFGEAKPEKPMPHEMIDLMSLLNGASCLVFSNAHYGHPRNMIKPGKSHTMADGWETARRLDRPEIIETNFDGTLKVPGEEYAIFKLGFPGTIRTICVDTAHFKGNYPDSVKIQGAYLGQSDCAVDLTAVCWHDILKPSKLSAHREHWYNCDFEAAISHLRIVMAPDGGISRIRIFGYIEECVDM